MTMDKPLEPSNCLNCKAAVWRAQVCGFKVALDCGLVTVPAEILCFLAVPRRRNTFGIYRLWAKAYADLRTLSNIGRAYDLVLAKHECGSPQALAAHPDYWPAPAGWISVSTDTPPY